MRLNDIGWFTVFFCHGCFALPDNFPIKLALADQDEAAVHVSVAQRMVRLGGNTVKTELPTHYYPPINPAPFNADALRATWLRDIEHATPKLPWRRNPSADPRKMRLGLREAAVPLDALARTALLMPDQRERLKSEVIMGADWLLKTQQTTGLFAYPIGPTVSPHEKVGKMVAHAIKKRPELVTNGWVVADENEGGLQYDHGLCGHVLIATWALTKDARYLAAARKAADWAMTHKLVLNWNYNAFSVGMLAHVALATGEEKYLKAALAKARLGVLPGQLPSGRWMDTHNASAVYHNILLRELLWLWRALPANHAFRPTLQQALVAGINQAADETLQHGYAGTWADNFSQGLLWIGETAKWRDALNIAVNASGKNGAPSLGVNSISVLEEVFSDSVNSVK